MQQNDTKCYKRVGGRLQCLLCNSLCIKYGKSSAGKQRYKCKNCNKTFIDTYTNHSYITPDISIVPLVKEGCGIRSIARLLKIAGSTVLKCIVAIAKNIKKPVVSLNKTYEVDEMRTYYKNKSRLLWIVYAVQRDTKQITDFAVGSRTKTTLQKVIDTLYLSNASKIYTDKLNFRRCGCSASVFAAACVSCPAAKNFTNR